MMAKPIETVKGDCEGEAGSFNRIGNRFFYWQSEVFGEVPDIIVTPGGIFDDPPDLIYIVDRIAVANQKGMTYAQFSGFIDELDQYIADNPKYANNGFMHLGHLYNAVNPATLRNRDKALNYYKEVSENVGSNTDLAQLYILMASCYTQNNGQCNINQVGNYYLLAAVADQRFASLVGDMYLYGWGTYSDLELAAHFYTIGMNHGDHGANQKLRYVQFLSKMKKFNENDSTAFHDFERYSYHTHITGSHDRAFMSMMAAAEKNYVPSFDYLAQYYYNNLSNIHDPAQIRSLTFKWLRKGADAGYSPCIYSLALLVGNDVIDSLKGDIYKKDNNGNFSEKDKKSCAKQSFELLERANLMGSTLSMVEMGDRYFNGTTYDYPAQSLKKALICYTTASMCGSVEAQKKLDKIVNDHENEITQEYIKMIRSTAEEIVEYITVQIEDIFKSIESNANVRNPRILNNTYTLNNCEYEINEEDPLYAANLAKGYQTAYEMYANYLAEMSRMGQEFISGNGETYQDLMRQIRTRALRLPLPIEISQSKWESWTLSASMRSSLTPSEPRSRSLPR